MQELFRVKQTAQYMGIGVSTVWLFTKQGKIKAIKLSDRVTVWAIGLRCVYRFSYGDVSMNRQTHMIRVLVIILKEGDKTSTDITHVANVNQYFVALEKMGILYSYWGYKGKARVKYRAIANHAKALAYVNAMRSKNPA